MSCIFPNSTCLGFSAILSFSHSVAFVFILFHQVLEFGLSFILVCLSSDEFDEFVNILLFNGCLSSSFSVRRLIKKSEVFLG